ncbi:MAG: FAD-dependent oxidoreductase [bacterium]
MDRSDFVIIGGVAVGPKTAATLARRLPNAGITLFQKEEQISYAQCGLPYIASGELGDLKELTVTPYGVVRDTDFFRNTKGFEAITGAEVIGIDREKKIVSVRMNQSGETIKHAYGKLVIATGAVPNQPPFPVPDSPLVRSFTRPDDAVSFRRLAEQGKVGQVVIVGGGFISCELVDAVRDMWGIEATLVEKENQLLPFVLDFEMAAIVRRTISGNGVKVLTETTVDRIDLDADGRPVVHIAGHGAISTDYVFLCLGVHPETTLAHKCGLEVGETGGIVVDSHLQTSDQDIYAGGDCIESWHQVTGEKFFLSMGSLANRHGRVIAENLAGGNVEFPGTLGAFLLKVLDVNVGSVGLSQQAAEKAGFGAKAVWGTFPDKPDYHPDKQMFVLKLVYNESDGKLLGIQGVGAGDVCRRVDVFSSFLRYRGTLDDLIDLEHGYTPAYSEPLDPLYQMATIAAGQRNGMDFIDPGSDFSGFTGRIVWLDVRETEEADTKPLPVAISEMGQRVVNIPLNDLRGRLDELEHGKKMIVVCQRGSRSYQAALTLKQSGFDDVHVLGGGLATLM